MTNLNEYRCPKCNKLLFEACVPYGVIAKKCDRCNEMRTFTINAHVASAMASAMASDWHGMTRTASKSETHVHQEKHKQVVIR